MNYIYKHSIHLQKFHKQKCQNASIFRGYLYTLVQQ